ncbi:MAG TPA: ABC transporter permease [Thermoanaerobaculia bacterium]|nr:ABC transporter permease [Thermoanaerobaculia bacterium]
MNLRHAIRSLVVDWRFSLFVLLIIAAGIGLNTAIYSIVDASLLRPLPFPGEERLVRVFASNPDGTQMGNSMSFPVYNDYREQSRSFESLAAFTPDWEMDFAVSGREPQQILGGLASGNYFETLGVTAQRGRMFDADDERAARHVVVISDSLWRSQFGSRDDIIGTPVRINAASYTIAGVAPPRFRGATIDGTNDVWVPVSTWAAALPGMGTDNPLLSRATVWIMAVGRLRDGVSLEQAQAELRTIAARRAAQQVKDVDPSATLLRASDAAIDIDSRGGIRRVAMLVTLFVALILVMACVNAGALQLVRGERRQRELAIRTALGASRRTILAQLALEGLLLAAAAGVAGIALAHGFVNGLAKLLPANFPLIVQASSSFIDARVLAVTTALVLASAIVMAVIPGIRSSRLNPAAVMKGTRTLPHGTSLQSLLVVVQITLSVVLLVFAGLMVRTLLRMRQVDPGFPTQNAVVGTISVSRQGYDGEARTRFFDQLRARLAQMPGVVAAGFGRSVPVQGSGMRSSVKVAGYTPKPGDPENVDFNPITPGYFRALGLPVVRGRDFTEADMKSKTPIAIVNEEMARHFWPNGDALGGVLMDGEERTTVVGIVRTTKVRSLREDPTPVLFIPASTFMPRAVTMLVRANSEANAASALRNAVRSIDPRVPIFQLRSLADHVGVATQKERALAILVGGFSALALLLASIGLFGVVAYRTGARRKELGIRIALGAQWRDVASIVVGQTVRLTATGTLIGLVAAAFLTRFAESLLFGVIARDPVTFIIVPCLLLAISIAATFLPMRQATSIAPSQTLRYE